MGVVLDRARLVDAVRSSPSFRAAMRELERKAERTAVAVARQKGIERDTGDYEGGFEALFMPVAQTAVVGRLRLFNSVAHAQILEAGSQPHLIKVRKARVLYSAKLDVFFGLQVNHPGTKPYNVIRDALRRVAAGQ